MGGDSRFGSIIEVIADVGFRMKSRLLFGDATDCPGDAGAGVLSLKGIVPLNEYGSLSLSNGVDS